MISEIISKVAEVQNKLSRFGYKPFPIESSIGQLKPKCAGQAYYRNNSIKVSKDYLKEFPERILKITVPHEICHLYVFKYCPSAKQAHGPEFRKFMKLLGLEGKTYHDMKLENTQENTRLKKRYIWQTVLTKKSVKLTSGQHKKLSASPESYSYKGEKLVYLNKVETFK